MQFSKGDNAVEATVVNGTAGTSIDSNTETTVETVRESHETALVVVQNNLATVRDSVKEQIIKSGEAQKISDQIQVTSPQSIVEFGRPVAEEMSKVADQVLSRTSSTAMTETGKMMTALSKVMQKVDIGEIKEATAEQAGFFGKIMNRAQKKLDQFMSKYQSIGKEIEQICIELRTYEQQIKDSNKELEKLYENGVQSYQTLMKYTIAGDLAMAELDQYEESIRARANSDPSAQLELNNLSQVRQLLEQRIQDLRLAESVALQSLPTLKAIEFGNLNLDRKINSAFIITLPVFKNAIAQAVFIKQQALQAKALSALDQQTNEMLLRNAENVADNMRMTAGLAGKSSIDIETIEKSWDTITKGIQDTQQIQAELSRQRVEDKEKLEQINQIYLSQVK